MMRKKISRYKSKKVFAKSFRKNAKRRFKQKAKRNNNPRGGYRL
jgi:hypothetical protein